MTDRVAMQCNQIPVYLRNNTKPMKVLFRFIYLILFLFFWTLRTLYLLMWVLAIYALSILELILTVLVSQKLKGDNNLKLNGSLSYFNPKIGDWAVNEILDYIKNAKANKQ